MKKPPKEPIEITFELLRKYFEDIALKIEEYPVLGKTDEIKKPHPLLVTMPSGLTLFISESDNPNIRIGRGRPSFDPAPGATPQKHENTSPFPSDEHDFFRTMVKAAGEAWGGGVVHGDREFQIKAVAYGKIYGVEMTPADEKLTLREQWQVYKMVKCARKYDKLPSDVRRHTPLPKLLEPILT